MPKPTVHFSSFDELGAGPSAMRLIEHDGDIGVLRPFREIDTHGRETGRNCMTINTGRRDKDGKPAKETVYTNAPAYFTKDAWMKLIDQVNWAVKFRLQAWSDLYGTNPYNIDNGLGVLILRDMVATGKAEANFSMDGIRRSERSRPLIDTRDLPLPICHSDGEFSMRDIAVSKRSQIPLNTAGIMLAAEAVAEMIEQLTLGTIPAYSFGTGTAYGYRTHPNRLTKVITLPSGGGWTPATTYNEMLDMIQQLEDLGFRGPYVLYRSTGWTKYMSQDYNATYPVGDTLDGRIRKIPKILKIQEVDFLPDFEMILVDLTPKTAQGVVGMPLHTVQWEGDGGMSSMFKTLTISVPWIHTDYDNYTGIVHATAFAGGTTTTSTTTTTTTTTP